MPFTFEENQTVETLDTVPENFRVFYEANAEEGGGFSIAESANVKAAVSIIAGQTKALNAARAEAKGLKGKAVDTRAAMVAEGFRLGYLD